MSSLIEIEQAAAKLRRYLKLAQRPDLKLICGLRFFDLFRDSQTISSESYLREFLPVIAEAAGKCCPRELFPEDAESLARLIESVANQTQGISIADDLILLRKLDSALAANVPESVEITAGQKGAIRVPCLFVEYYPDLDLPPRGRVLDLHVTASPISAKAEADDIVVRNPVSEPDDRFLMQARDSVTAARKYLADRYGLSSRKKFRFDFAVDSTGARFTGDSLGAAFAVGAVAAVAQIEVFRERLSIASNAAFSGALASDGRLNQIDAEALKLKIFRAFNSDLKLMVIPRQHITDAWAYLSELETRFPGRKLELVGAESLEAIASDPRLVPPERFSTPAYFARRAWQAKRSTWVEFPAVLALAAILFVLIAPPSWMPWFDWRIDHLVASGNYFVAINPDGKEIWRSIDYGKPFHQGILDAKSSQTDRPLLYWAADHDHDGKDELFIAPGAIDSPQISAVLQYYDHQGHLLWTREASAITSYPGDTAILQYAAFTNYSIMEIMPFQDSSLGDCVITSCSRSSPYRQQITTFDCNGNRISGPYIHTGESWFATITNEFAQFGHRQVLIGIGTNNRFDRRGCLYVLDPTNLQGVSPPYNNDLFFASQLPKGSQLLYVTFGKTELSQGEEVKSWAAELVRRSPKPHLFDVYVSEGDGIEVDGRVLVHVPITELPYIIYTLDTNLSPVQAYLSDGEYGHLNGLLRKIGKSTYSDRDSLLDHLLRTTVVFLNDSILQR